MKRILLASAFAFCAFASSLEESVGRLLVFNSEELPEKQVISPEQVSGVLGHLNGFSGAHSHLFDSSSSLSSSSSSPLSNFMVVVDGAPLRLSSSITFSSSSASSPSLGLSPSGIFEIQSDHAESGQDLISRMIGGQAFKGEFESATLGDLLCQTYENSAIFSVSTDPLFAQLPLPHREVLKSNPSHNAFGAHFNPRAMKSKIFGQKNQIAEDFVRSLFAEENSDESKGREQRLFEMEMKALSSFLSSLHSSQLSALFKYNSPDSLTFVVSSLKKIRDRFGVDSPQYQSAWTSLVSVISEVEKEFTQTYKEEGLFEVLLVEGRPKMLKQKRAIQRRDYTNVAATCFDTQEVCNNSTNSCSGLGECVLVKESINPPAKCFRCKCQADYTGESCEFINIVAPFHIIFWISLTLILSLVIISQALAYMDPGTDTLLFRTSSKPKKE